MSVDADQFLRDAGSIKLSKHGEWWHDGVRFENEKLSKLFHRSITWCSHRNAFVLRMGKYEANFSCEDVAYFVVRIHEDQEPWQICLADGRVQELRTETLVTGLENQLYCQLLDGHFARFARPAHQQMLTHTIDEHALFIAGKRIALRSRCE